MKSASPKRLLCLLLLACLGARPSAYADEISGMSDAAGQRAVIEDARRTQTQRLDALAKDCERNFAVTRCLDQLRAERLAVERGLNRQETVLNDVQRQERGREQTERNREKAAAQDEKMASLASVPSVQAKQPKLAPQPNTQTIPRQPVSAAQEPSLSVAERSAHAKDFQRKQAAAVAKRAEVAKRLKDAGVTKPSLPKPE